MRMTGSRAKKPVNDGATGTTSLGRSLSSGAEEAAGGWGVGESVCGIEPLWGWEPAPARQSSDAEPREGAVVEGGEEVVREVGVREEAEERRDIWRGKDQTGSSRNEAVVCCVRRALC